MDGKCVVETWAQFGCRSAWRTAKVLSMGTDVLLCAFSDEVHVFNKQEKKLKASLQFPCHLTDTVLCPDKRTLYAVCDSGVYSVNLSSILSRVQSSSGSQSSSLSVFEISSDCLAVKDKTVCSLLVVGTILLTLSKRVSAWGFSLYKIPSSIQTGSSGHEKVTELSLSMVSDGSRDNMEPNQGTWRGRRPVLTCIYSSDNSPQSANSTSSPSPPSDGHCLLQPILFKLLFGVEVALSKSPVILCGLPDGRLCSFPLRPPGSQVRILHSLEQPVVLIGTSMVASDTEAGAGAPRCLVVVGGEGRVLLVSTREEGAEAGGKVAGFAEGFVSGPVECGYVDEDEGRLYYSTGADLLSLDLPMGPSGRAGPVGGNAVDHRERQNLGRGEEVASKTVAFQRPASLNVYGITTLIGPSQRNTAGALQLVGLSSSGRLQAITLPKGQDDRGLPSIPSSQVGQRIRDLLAAIGDVCDRASVLKRTIQDKNDILRQLNQVLNISCLMLADHNSDPQILVQAKPIRCHAVPSWSRFLQQDSLHLTCVLENSSCYVLEHGWSFCVTVLPLSYPPAVATKNTSRTFMFPFSSLHPGEKFEVSLPLAAAEDVTFPVTVCCTLIFSLKGLVGEDVLSNLKHGHAGAEPQPGLDSSCVSLALETLTVDWLDALRLGINSTDAVAMDVIQGFISSRSGGGTGRLAAGPELYSACIRVSSELLSTTVVLETLEVDPQKAKMAPTHLCVSVLHWLLSQSPGRGEMGSFADTSGQGNSVVHTRSPGGHRVKLTAKEVTLGLEVAETAEMPLRAVEVQIESSSLAAVCGLHHALLRRLQSLLQGAPEEAVSTAVERLGLRQALRRAEAMLQQLQQSRTPEAFGVVSSGGQMNQSLLSVYRQLRENPLLII